MQLPSANGMSSKASKNTIMIRRRCDVLSYSHTKYTYSRYCRPTYAAPCVTYSYITIMVRMLARSFIACWNRAVIYFRIWKVTRRQGAITTRHFVPWIKKTRQLLAARGSSNGLQTAAATYMERGNSSYSRFVARTAYTLKIQYAQFIVHVGRCDK